MSNKPGVVLVHGFWGGAAHWAKVIVELNGRGYDSLHAVENPLTSLHDDAERTQKMLKQVEGPVLLVGHSYGGAVITQAGGLPNVAGLVYVAAFAPDAGESLGQISEWKVPAAVAAGNIAPDSDGYVWIKQDKFQESFCQDLSGRRGARDGRDAEGAGRIDLRGHNLRPGLEEEVSLVPGLDQRPDDSSGQRAPDGRTHEASQHDRTRRQPRLTGLTTDRDR